MFWNIKLQLWELQLIDIKSELKEIIAVLICQIARYKITLQDKKPDYDIKDLILWYKTLKYKVVNTKSKSHNI